MDKARLLNRTPADLPQEDVEIPGVGTVRVRALSRAEALLLPADDLIRESEILSLALVDPEMTRAEVDQWLSSSPAGELQEVSRRVAIISGMMEDSAKAAYKSDGGEPVD